MNSSFNGVQAKKGDWLCSSCGDLNFANRTSCRKCSNPKNSGSQGPATVQVRAGDWNCSACNHLNFARNQCCRNCKAVPSLISGSRTNSSQNNSQNNRPAPATTATPPAKPGDWSCTSCGDYNFARNQTCRKCKNPKPSSAPVPTTSNSSVSNNPSQDDEKNLCVVCMENPAQIAITVCGHLCLCPQCSSSLNACPLCRATFTSSDLLKIFVSGI